MTREKRINYLHIFCVATTVGFILCSVFVFPSAFKRLLEGGRDFGVSVGYFFAELFGKTDTVTPTVTQLPDMDNLPVLTIPETLEGFKIKLQEYFVLFKSNSNLYKYFMFLDKVFLVLTKGLLLVIPFVLLVYLLFQQYLKTENNHYDKDSKPLKIFKKAVQRTYAPLKKQVLGFVDFLKNNKAYYIVWLLIWAYNLNLFTILLEFLAYYLYFALSFRVDTLYMQIYKLFLDLYVPLRFVPLWVWIIAGVIVLDIFRKKVAYARLNHFERKNRGFINARPIVFIVCGTMGKKKTTAITDMALSQEVMFRDKAFEKILENDLKFPFFAWCNLENELKRAMEYGEVFNLATVRKFVHKKKTRFFKSKTTDKIFDYDFNRYGFTYDDKLKVVDIWEVIETYSQLYFIYVIQSSLLISNYSVRVDNILEDIGNFPLWNTDFFKRDSRLSDSFSRHSHILDFDSLRLGKKVIDNNLNKDNFEFGVVLITEVGKERGNTIELSDKKKKDDIANQKNDLFNSWLKMVRHSATVDNFPFVRVICDEQRPESWGADARDLCEIVHVRDSGDITLAMPFFSLEELLYGWLFSKFERLYYDYRFTRSDNTLPMYLLKGLTSKIHSYYKGIYNRFGYCKLNVQIESGTQDGELEKNKYYLMNKKVYSKRFSTDCFSDFFTEKSLRSRFGIDDLEEYATEKASFAELEKQNSYFINELLNGMRDEDKK